MFLRKLLSDSIQPVKAQLLRVLVTKNRANYLSHRAVSTYNNLFTPSHIKPPFETHNSDDRKNKEENPNTKNNNRTKTLNLITCSLLFTNIGLWCYKDEENKINTNSYYYHSIGGFDIFKVVSIVKNGILSKKTAEKKGVISSSSGLRYNGDNRISIATSDVLQTKDYAGTEISFIIKPSGLTVLKPHQFLHPEEFEDAIAYERQIVGEIPTTNIVGIMMPNEYLTNDLSKLTIFNDICEEMLKINMSNLDDFLKNELSVSLFFDRDVMRYYDEAIEIFEAMRVAGRPSDDITGRLIKMNEVRKKFRKDEDVCADLNVSMMKFIKNTYEKKLGKYPITALDIVRHHLGDKYPIYNKAGKLLTPTIDNFMKHLSNQFCPY